MRCAYALILLALTLLVPDWCQAATGPIHHGSGYWFELAGSSMLIISWLWMLVLGFGAAAFWGIAMVLVPPAAMAMFSFRHMDVAAQPFFLGVFGTLVLVFGLSRSPPLAAFSAESDVVACSSEGNEFTNLGRDLSKNDFLCLKTALTMLKPLTGEQTVTWSWYKDADPGQSKATITDWRRIDMGIAFAGDTKKLLGVQAPGWTLGSGHHRVELLINGRVASSSTFDLP